MFVTSEILRVAGAVIQWFGVDQNDPATEIVRQTVGNQPLNG